MGDNTSTRTKEVIEERLRIVSAQLGREMPPHPPIDRTPAEHHQHLLEEAQELYRNELAWEEESGEESTGSGAVVELVFPGTLALIDALVTSHDLSEKGEGARHRDVVASFLDWLAALLFELRTGEAGGAVIERAKHIDITDSLIDLVIYRYCDLSPDEIERLEAARN